MAVTTESYAGKIQRKLLKKQKVIEAASGRKKADLVLKNATFVNVFSNELTTCDIACANGLIVGLGDYDGVVEYDMTGKIVCPGFIDAHIHLESSLVSPKEFVRATLPHGTTTVITDPHEITNVMGTDGIDYMFQATEGLPIDVRFMLPSCVPATPMDESGANLDYRAIDSFYDYPRVQGLAEMMNAYGVIHNDKEVVSKIVAAQAHHKKIDGHAPGLTGKDLDTYVAAGVYSDHECSTMEDALEKLKRGQFIMIREGTAARNLEALAGLLTPQYAERCMFCTDDKHPNDLLEKGHIDYICREAINKYGADPILTVKVACHHAARYFLLNNRGAIAPGYLADFAIIDNFRNFNVEMVFKKGELYYNDGKLKEFPAPAIEEYLDERAHDTFHVRHLTKSDFEDVRQRGVIGMIPGEIVSTDNGYADHVDLQKDILKIAVVERHKNTGHIGLGYIQGYGLKSGAVATSISHDSHNIIVVGTNAEDMAFAVNYIVENHGGIVVVDGGKVLASVVLEIAGIMSDEPLTKMNEELEAAKDAAFRLGVSRGIDPFMTLSFMALPVIPTLRITTRGVIDVNTQQYI
ncbi:MAG: adenine deaminase [Oscillospiraceae bacterium]|nr:adenine deaminase [Clostridiales bacterium]MDD7487600.1 adenine deaminase [Clostridiales bacterium]MDY2691222.1 adenine deaminase [Oscillospiraceae bacterium]